LMIPFLKRVWLRQQPFQKLAGFRMGCWVDRVHVQK
jgi:hypothetical protein